MKKFIVVITLTTVAFIVKSQNKQPKLVVGIVIDQMRYDYIYRFWDKFSDNGFKKLVTNGFVCESVYYNYMPTYTGPGHASIYTGTTPANHGIIANTWFDKKNKTLKYCVENKKVKTVGSKTNNGQMSPQNLLATTITDQLRLATNFKGKVIGISIKDRGAILPSGHFANAAYWFDGGDEGKFISSTFYMDKLPEWVADFNNLKLPEKYITQTWKTLYSINEYSESVSDNNVFEKAFKGMDTPTFPYQLSKLRKENDNYSLLKTTPFGNTLLKEFAKAAIKGEALGNDNITDFLTISFSSTDYVGHRFGPQSIELEDTYLRLDRDLADFITFLEEVVGKENFILFLTADHAASYTPTYLSVHKYNVSNLSEGTVFTQLNNYLKTQFNIDSLILSTYNQQVYFDDEKIMRNNLDKEDIIEIVVSELLKINGVYKVYTRDDILELSGINPIEKSVMLGFNQKLSGDIMYVLIPGWLSTSYTTGTTHGSPYTYDKHVPLIFYGKNIVSNRYYQQIEITDIAVTLARMLKIQEPNASIGKPIIPLLQQYDLH